MARKEQGEQLLSTNNFKFDILYILGKSERCGTLTITLMDKGLSSPGLDP